VSYWGTSMQHPFGKRLKHAIKLAAKRSPAGPILRLLLVEPDPLQRAIKVAAKAGFPEAARWLLSPPGRAVLEDERLHAELRGRIGNDIDRELLLTEVRRQLLLERRELVDKPSVQRFVSALVQQCINNEYVYFVTEEEASAIEELLRRAHSLHSGVASDARSAYLLAMYQSPQDIPAYLLPYMTDGPLGLLVRDYMGTYKEESAIREAIEVISTVENDGSRPVASMYEDNPYPRWLDIVPRPAGARIVELLNHFTEGELPLTRPWDILAAGCGTGRDTIAMASGYGERANVLAIDISRASLAYAIRKARSYDIKNIRFAQCDIHAVERLGRQFDIVECSGVLHHLKDPLVGWRHLVERLRPGGLMYIAVYSALARREVIRIRQDVARRGGVSGPDFIRQYRREMMLEKRQLIDSDSYDLPNRWDFFSMSGCRDLLFHVVEHQFTIPEIQASLIELGLQFRGFELPGLLSDHYWIIFPDGRKRLDLDAWAEFEHRYPNAFGSLYGFWCRKP
jgi:SAM-dependent methyltransferase